jgi:hypothetical protein
MARIVVGLPNLTQPLLLYPGLGPAMLEQHRRSYVYLFTHSQNSLPSEPSVYVSTCNVLDVITCIIVDFVLLKCMEHIKKGSAHSGCSK